MKAIYSDKVPQATGPYAQAIEVNGFLFCSGMLPINPTTGEIEGEDAASQAEQILNNIKVLLDDAKSGLHQVVKTTVFLQSMEDFSAVNEVYESFFQNHKPARSCIEVAALPRQALVEIEVITLQN